MRIKIDRIDDYSRSEPGKYLLQPFVAYEKSKLHKEGTPQEVIQYQIIEDVYKTVVVTATNPVNSKPAVFLVPQKSFCL